MSGVEAFDGDGNESLILMNNGVSSGSFPSRHSEVSGDSVWSSVIQSSRIEIVSFGSGLSSFDLSQSSVVRSIILDILGSVLELMAHHSFELEVGGTHIRYSQVRSYMTSVHK